MGDTLEAGAISVRHLLVLMRKHLIHYSFMFNAHQDFEPIVARLIAEGQKEPYDWDRYAEAFFPKAEELYAKAIEAEQSGNHAEASELYM